MLLVGWLNYISQLPLQQSRTLTASLLADFEDSLQLGHTPLFLLPFFQSYSDSSNRLTRLQGWGSLKVAGTWVAESCVQGGPIVSGHLGQGCEAEGGWSP